MGKADMILKSTAIFTGKTDTYFPGGIAIASNRIVAIEKDSAWEAWMDENTQVYDMGNRLIMPGFVDAHFHFFEGAIASSEYMCCDIEQSKSEEDCIRIIKGFADEHPTLQRILGTGWLQVNWGGEPLPSCKSLDLAFPDTPVYLLCGDGHTFWLNTVALNECGITPETEIAFGEIMKNKDGSLNGILIEIDACALAWNKIYKPDDIQIMRKTQVDLGDKLIACGVTSACNMTSKSIDGGEEELYETAFQCSQEGTLKCRLHLYPSLGMGTDFSMQKLLREKYNSSKFQISGLKQFLDGVTTTYTGYLIDPYEDNPSTKGTTNFPLEAYEAPILAANRDGFSVRLHTIANGSVRAGLDLFEKSNQINGNESIRNCLEHCEDIYMEDIPRFKNLNVVASLQPIHLILDSNEKEKRIGKERAMMEWPHKTLLDHGAIVAFGTDYPVAHFNPLPNIQAAVTRGMERDQVIGPNPGEKLSVAQALRAYTYGGACALHRESELGLLEAEMLADITVLDRNIFEIDPYRIKECCVHMTIVDGKIVYKSDGGEL